MILPLSHKTAGLFTWASGRTITKREAMRCARRDPGRSWEAIHSELDKLGACTNAGATPISRQCERRSLFLVYCNA